MSDQPSGEIGAGKRSLINPLVQRISCSIASNYTPRRLFDKHRS
jgi:hypothetical protein